MRKTCEINPEIVINEGDYDISLHYIEGNHIALSQLGMIDKESALGFLSLSKSKDYKDLKNKTKELIENTENIYFFNRLNVPVSMRGKGLGDMLLKSTLNLINEKNALIINTANNYGEMGQSQLIEFYQKNGFKLLHKEGLLVYHHELENPSLNSKIKLI